MKFLLGLFAFSILSLALIFWYEEGRDPYEVGMHADYSIICEEGFVYKVLDRHRGTIPVLNSDGTPLKCGQKRK